MRQFKEIIGGGASKTWCGLLLRGVAKWIPGSERRWLRRNCGGKGQGLGRRPETIGDPWQLVGGSG